MCSLPGADILDRLLRFSAGKSGFNAKQAISHWIAERIGQSGIAIVVVKAGMGGLEGGMVNLLEALAEIFAHQGVAIKRAGRVRVGG